MNLDPRGDYLITSGWRLLAPVETEAVGWFWSSESSLFSPRIASERSEGLSSLLSLGSLRRST